jgi:hypothetical protein
VCRALQAISDRSCKPITTGLQSYDNLEALLIG